MLTNFTVFTLSLAGFIALALAMPRHGKQVLRKALSDSLSRWLRIAGWLLLCVALMLGINAWHTGVGIVTWLGWLAVAGVVLVFSLSKIFPLPEQTAAGRGADLSRGEGTLALTNTKPAVLRNVLAATLLLLPLAFASWQLLTASVKPLLREDAIHGQIGPWSFVLAELNQRSPQIVAFNVPLKQFVIRFCEGCEAEIRMAYLKVRQPHNLRAAGNAFEGEGMGKIAGIPLPRAATLDDGIWLTVESKNGEVYQQQFAIQHLSPASARFIQEQQ